MTTESPLIFLWEWQKVWQANLRKKTAFHLHAQGGRTQERKTQAALQLQLTGEDMRKKRPAGLTNKLMSPCCLLPGEGNIQKDSVQRKSSGSTVCQGKHTDIHSQTAATDKIQAWAVERMP